MKIVTLLNTELADLVLFFFGNGVIYCTQNVIDEIRVNDRNIDIGCHYLKKWIPCKSDEKIVIIIVNFL